MTTIAFKDGVLAADTQSSYGNQILAGIVKVTEKRGVLAAGVGDATACKGFLDWVRSGCKGSPPRLSWDQDKDWRGTGYIFLDGYVIEFWPHGAMMHRPTFFAAGSGAQFALGAMAVGASAEEAVRIATIFDNGTGGDVMVVR